MCVCSPTFFLPLFEFLGAQVDLLLPRKYPVAEKAADLPAISLVSNTTMLCCRPTELYLGASTSARKMQLSVHWDNNVFDEALINEWLDEVKNAIDYYLGEDSVRTKL